MKTWRGGVCLCVVVGGGVIDDALETQAVRGS